MPKVQGAPHLAGAYPTVRWLLLPDMRHRPQAHDVPSASPDKGLAARSREMNNGRRKQAATGRGKQRREQAVQFGCAVLQTSDLPSPTL